MTFGQDLCCQCFAHTRWATDARQPSPWKETSHILKQDIDSLSFAWNKILEAILGSPIPKGSCEPHDELHRRRRDMNIVKRSLTPFDRSDVVNGKLHCDW